MKTIYRVLSSVMCLTFLTGLFLIPVDYAMAENGGNGAHKHHKRYLNHLRRKHHKWHRHVKRHKHHIRHKHHKWHKDHSGKDVSPDAGENGPE